ncbi:MAG TPA: hypothetical protein VMD49_08620 [Steroidobacteraceae bacterium]|nr:hypothetical protein [Steroidobacteraceae bacterium]
MRGNSVIFLRAAPEAWLTVQASPGIDPQAVHGCVDWYLYHEAGLAACARAHAAVLPEQGAHTAPASAPLG